MKHKPSCAIYDPCPSQCDCCAPTDYQQGFQAGAASRDAEVAKWKAAEHSLSDAYLRLRGLLDAFDTPRGVTAEQVWEHTEGKLIDLISERDQLRAQINKLREAINRQPYTMDREVCEALAATPEQSLAEYRNKAADRIEELERERDAFYMDYRMKCDEEAKDSALVIIERDQLRAQINVLREAVKVVEADSEEVLDFDECMAMCLPMDAYHGLIEAAEATPEQSLAEYRNKVIENCAKQCEAPNEYVFHRTCYESAEAIRTIKDQP